MMKTHSLAKASMFALGAVVSIHSAHASRSSFYPNTSSDFRISARIQNETALKDPNGGALTLTKDGLLLRAGESASQFSEQQQANRRIDHFDLNLNGDTGKSEVRLMSSGSIVDSDSKRVVAFNLPVKVEIDSAGRPEGLDGVTATAEQTGQGVGLKFTRTRIGEWIPFHYDTYEYCSIDRVRQICHPVGGHGGGHGHGHGHGHGEVACHIETISIPGRRHVVVDGSSKSDDYSMEIETVLTTGFSLSYETRNTSSGPCIPN